jgi:hypothetical protein
MRYAKWILVGFLTLSILAPPAAAQRRSRRNQRNAIAAAAVLGVISAVAASRSNRGYYRDGGHGYVYGNGYDNVYGSGYGAYSPYRAAVPGSPYGYRTARTDNPYQGGPFSYVDEGAYRNYRDAAGNFVGRVPLASLVGERW